MALAVPLSRFTSRVGGGSAFYVRHRQNFMRILHYIATAALLAVLVIGCSKKPSEQTHHPKLPAGTVDLGAVELVPQTPTQFSLGAGKSCILTGKQLQDGVDVKMTLFVTNADGTVEHSSGGVWTLPGRKTVLIIGSVPVGFAPTLKTP